MNIINVGIADFKIDKAPNVLVTISLGSCVGIIIYDRVTKIGSLAHIMLPDSKKCKIKVDPCKYADTAIVMMYEKMLSSGADKKNIFSKIFGGANMFRGAISLNGFDIGNKNVEATKEILKKLEIPIIAEDTGSNYGRTIEFYLDTGEVLVKSYACVDKRL